ncbi:MAG: ParB/RepB/Spo0J family partition protein [Bdellovibrionales bacterium]
MSEDLAPLRKIQKKGLGRGIGSLLGEMTSSQEEASETKIETPIQKREELSTKDRVIEAAIENLYANKEQPRRMFDQEKLKELSESIKQKGILLPIIVRKRSDGKLEIIAGERRWRASQLAGLKTVPVLIKEIEAQESLELALIENIQRQDLNPMEEAEAYSILINKYGLTQLQIAEKVSKDRVTIANLLRLTNFGTEIKQYIKEGSLQLGQAKVLLGVEDQRLQNQLAKRVVSKKLSVRATELLVQKAKALTQQGLSSNFNSIDKSQQLNLINLTNELKALLGTKVELDMNGHKTKLSIQFYSKEELNQFIDKLRATKQ